MKKLIILWLGLLLPALIFAQQAVNFTVSLSAGDTLSLYETVKIHYKIEGTEYQDFQLPEFEGFRVTSGPYQSTSVQYVNGKMSRETSYIFQLQAEAEGNFFFTPATIKIGEEVMESNAINITVVDDGIERPKKKAIAPKERPAPVTPFPPKRKKKPVYSI